MFDENEELECRVCRSSGDDRPLYSPCKCSGSVGKVHQDCLEQWLSHTKNEKCEICSFRYRFIPKYAENAPNEVSIGLLYISITKKFFFVFIPIVLRISIALLLWLVVTPLATCWLYRAWMRQNTWSYQLIRDRSNFQMIKADIIEGLVIALVIAISLIVIISFADFLRFNWAHVPNEGQRREPRRRNNANIPNQQQPLPVQRRIWRNENNPIPRQQNEPNLQRQQNEPNLQQRLNEPNFQQRLNEPNFQQQLNEEIQQELQMLRQRQIQLTRESEKDEIPNRISDEDSKETISDNDEFKSLDNIDINLGLRKRNIEHYNEQNGEPEERRIPQIEEIHEIRHEPPHEVEPEVEEDEALPGLEEDIDIDDDNLDPQLGEVELHIAVDDILGLREPPYNLLRNVMWLISFNGFYIGVFASVPQIIGSALHLILGRVTAFNGIFDVIFLKVFIDALLEVHEACKKSYDALHLSDVFHISIGYTIIISVVFLCNTLVYVLRTYVIQSSVLNVVVELVNSLALMVKVGTLLFVRIFALPVCLGSIIIYCANTYYEYSRQAWIDFMSSNLVGIISLAWVVGISYMLTVTLSVLQLREVLHPDVLAKSIRPQEPHIDLLNSLMHESGLTHFRRVIASTIVYIVLLVLFIYIPMQLTRNIISKPEEDLHMAHFIPKLQLPAELALSHIFFLTVLDKKKNLIGQLQHNWIVFISRQLGITRYILPLPIKRSEVIGGIPIIGRPLRRPPAGWDARHTRNMTRWAWGTEEPSEIEKNLAPRVIPTFWFPKILLFFLSSWSIVAIGLIFLFIVPLNLGRLIFRYLDLPQYLRHDPLLFVIGSICLSIPISAVTKVCTKSISWRRRFFGDIKRHIASIYSTKSILYLFFKNISFWVLSELGIGFMVQIFYVNGLEEIFHWRTLCRIYLKGSIILGLFMMGIFSERYVPRILAYLSIENKFENWTREFKLNVFRPLLVLDNYQWETEIPRLTYIWNNLCKPLFAIIARKLISVIALGILSSKLRKYHKFDTITKFIGENDTNFMKIFIIVICFYYLTNVMSSAMYNGYIKLCKKIRDESYLIGKVLQNHSDN